MGTVTDRLEHLLTQQLSPSILEIINESHLHSGHQEQFDGSGENHLRIRITSPMFSGMTRVERHRKINEVVAPLMSEGLHAVAIEAKAPEDPA